MPTAIGRFRIDAVLGRGGMGEVYKAFDPTLQRVVAVKTIRPDIDRPEYLERMMREAQACARLSHPNIVTIYEAGQVDGVVFIAMEFLQGRNLAEALESNALSFDGKIRILTRVLDALEHAHGSDVVHRDIKPSNIHVQADGTIKLMDFGLARVMTADTITASGNMLGTPHYASPEQLKGEPVDRRSDVYSTGVMAYEMLAGRRPFEPDNSSISSVIIKVISEAPRPMNTDISRMLPEIESIVAKAMAKAPGERYQSAAEMREALVSFLDSSQARLSAIESAAGATVMLPSNGSIRQDAIPTRVDSRLTASASNAKWYWVGGAAAAAAVVGVMSMGLPSSNAEPASAGDAPPPPIASSTSIPPASNSVAAVSAPAPSVPREAATAGSGARDTGTAPSSLSSPASPASPAPVAAPDARELFSSPSSASVAPGLRFRMMLERPDGTAVDVDPAGDFHTGQRIRFAFESNVDGYLYVAQQGTSGNWTVLFPHPDINGGVNAVKRFVEHVVPNDDWFMLSGTPGDEQLFVFLSREPLNTLPGFDRPVREGYRPSPPQLVTTLASSIQSRDLILAKDKTATKGVQATYVVNKGELGKAVTAKFTIAHKP